MLRNEAAAYDRSLYERPHIVVLTKSDLLPPDAVLPRIDAPDAEGVMAISAAANRGLDELSEKLWELLCRSK